MTLEELKDALTKNNVIIGSKRTIKYLKTKNVKLVMIASNCPENIKNDINHYSKISKIKVEKFDGTAKQLGIFCGKPFPIATLAIKSEVK
ncbi:MAG: 50S ribosomal protein L30e [Candidatus Aenigmatarchaeota archaeon]